MHSLKKGRIQAVMSLFGDTKALESLEERLEAIEEIVESFGRKSRNLELEYIELYDKVRHQMSRMAKRYAPETPVLNDTPVVEDPDDGLDPISRSILHRREMPRNPP